MKPAVFIGRKQGFDRMNQTQVRLLWILNEFGEYLENAWDVPRSLSLPGLAESMKMVRSGLHKPLKQLEEEGYITKRLAHVVGGGTRKRQVFHITNQGRNAIELQIENKATHREPSEVTYRQISLFGREEFIQKCLSHLEKNSILAIGGMSGIGKSVVSRQISSRFTQSPSPIRIVDLLEGTDAAVALSTLYQEQEILPQSMDGISEFFNFQDGGQVFIFDDFHLLSPRHQKKMFTLIERCASVDGNAVLIVGKKPMSIPKGVEIFTLDALDIADAVLLLDESIPMDDRTKIATSLGGHPFALMLYEQGFELPEKQGDVQSFFEKSILDGLSQDEANLVAMLSLLPQPISVELSPQPEHISNLDDAALLKWTHFERRFELHHFVRNVKKAMLSEDEVRSFHQAYLQHLDTVEVHNDLEMLRLYHLLNSCNLQDIGEILDGHFDAILPGNSHQLAALFDSLLEQHQEHELLNYYAALTALERNEVEEVETKLQYLNPQLRNEIEYQFYLQTGKQKEASQILEQRIESAESPIGKNRMLLSGIIQRMEDRLFDDTKEMESSDIERMIEAIHLPDDPAKRAATLVSIAMIKHALAIYRKEYNKAEKIRKQLIDLSHESDILVQTLGYRSTLSQIGKNEFDSIFVDCLEFCKRLQHATHRLGLLMTLAETSFDLQTGHTEAILNEINQEVKQPHSISSHRIMGRWWYLHSKVHPKSRLMGLREASMHFRIGGCTENVKSIQLRIHRLL